MSKYKDRNLFSFIKFRSFEIVVCSRVNFIKSGRNVSNRFTNFLCLFLWGHFLRIVKHILPGERVYILPCFSTLLTERPFGFAIEIKDGHLYGGVIKIKGLRSIKIKINDIICGNF